MLESVDASHGEVDPTGDSSIGRSFLPTPELRCVAIARARDKRHSDWRTILFPLPGHSYKIVRKRDAQSRGDRSDSAQFRPRRSPRKLL
jgi:hypothetical protein